MSSHEVAERRNDDTKKNVAIEMQFRHCDQLAQGANTIQLLVKPIDFCKLEFTFCLDACKNVVSPKGISV